MVNTDKRSQTKTRRHTKKIPEHLHNVLIRSGKKGGGGGRRLCRNRRGVGCTNRWCTLGRRQVITWTGHLKGHEETETSGETKMDKTSSYDAPALDALTAHEAEQENH